MYNRLILGTAQFGMDYGISNKNGEISFKQIIKILNYLKKNKINYLETANSYSTSERKIGKYYLKFKKKFKIITKFSIRNNLNINHQYQKSVFHLGYKPEIIFAHTGKDYLNKNFRLKLFQLKKKYKIKKIGVSIYSPSEFYKILKVEKPDIIQVPCNILDKRFLDKKILTIAKRNKIQIHARSIFLQGLFFMKKNEIIKRFKNTKKTFNKLEVICNKENISLGELALLWINKKKEIKRFIIGIDNYNQIINNIKILRNKKIKNLSINEVDKINIYNNKIIKPYLWKKK